MKQYINLVKDILKNGTVRDDRTGTGTKSVFGRQLRFNLEDGFPACTSKKLAWKAVVSELLWFLEGSSNEHRLAEILRSKPYDEIPLDKRRTIWTDNFNKQGKDLGYENGDLGPVYGHQWRHWNGIDQIQNVIDTIKNNPFSRRILVNAWNVSDLEKMALPPCHYGCQFYTSEMTYDELGVLVKRLENEAKYKKYKPEHESLGKKFINKILKDVVAPVAVDYAKNSLGNALKNAGNAKTSNSDSKSKKDNNSKSKKDNSSKKEKEYQLSICR